jgi:heme exporter protein D
MMDFFAMGGYAFYVWGSYGMTALVIVAEVVALIGRRKAALEEARLSGPEDAAVAIPGRGAA